MFSWMGIKRIFCLAIKFSFNPLVLRRGAKCSILLIINTSRTFCEIDLNYSIDIINLFERKKYEIYKFFMLRNYPTPPFFKSGCQENYQFFTDFVGRVKISFDITLSDSNTGVVASINRGR